MSKTSARLLAREKRQARVRKKVLGTSDRPRLCVFRSLTHIYAQIINDDTGATIVALSSLSPGIKESLSGLKKAEAAKVLGKAIAEAAKSKGCDRVVFDRNGFLYHGRVKAMAEGAREAGLDF